MCNDKPLIYTQVLVHFSYKVISHKMAAPTFTHVSYSYLCYDKKRVATSPLECKDYVAFRLVWLQRTCQMSSEIGVLYFLRCRKKLKKGTLVQSL